MKGSMPESFHRAIAIDGPAASGKTTVARLLAERLGLVMVNSGEMYRAVALAAVRRGIDPSDREAVAGMLDGLDFRCGVRAGRSAVWLDGEEPGEALRSSEVNAAVSEVAAIPEVRVLLVARQRELLREGDLVMEGRDIGSVVFPETPFKIYVDASEQVRRERRAAEGLTDEVGSRDRLDAGRQTSPLKVAEGAAVIDSSHLSIAEVMERALQVLRDRGWFNRGEEGR